MIKPLTPLAIASFAFNFKTLRHDPVVDARWSKHDWYFRACGYTDLLVSYTYRIAFEGGGGQDFGLASAIATLIFLLVGALALLNLRFTKLSQN